MTVDALHSAFAADRQVLTLRSPSTANVAWSPDGSLIATGGSAGGNGQDDVIVWDARTGAKLRTLTGHTADVGYVAFSPDSSRVVSVAVDDRLIVWATGTGRELLSLTEQGLAFGGATFSPDGSLIVVGEATPGTRAATIKVLDATTDREILTIRAHSGLCQAPVFSPDWQPDRRAGVRVHPDL